MPSPKKEERNQQILYLHDEEGRTFWWIAKQMGIAEKNVRKIYAREKALLSMPKKKEDEA